MSAPTSSPRAGTAPRIAGGPSRKLRDAAALFGLSLARDGSLDTPARQNPLRWSLPLAARLDGLLKPGQLALVTGPSGAGKSALLARLTRRCAGRVVEATTQVGLAAGAGPASARAARRAVVDLLDLPLGETLGVLSAAGLAEARLLGLRAAHLSDGQRFRLALALAMARAGVRRGQRAAPLTLICDEFCSTLDRDTARSVCATLARWAARTPGLRVVVATAHADVEAWLRPHVVVRTRLAGGADIARAGHGRPARR